jgi:hypothetical protein
MRTENLQLARVLKTAGKPGRVDFHPECFVEDGYANNLFFSSVRGVLLVSYSTRKEARARCTAREGASLSCPRAEEIWGAAAR